MQLSCSKDWYDVKANKNLSVPSTLQDFEYLLDNYFVMNQTTPGIGEVASDGHFMTESSWNNLGSSSLERNAYTWTNAIPYLAVIDWNNSYNRVFQCNLVLDGLERIITTTTAEQKKLEGILGNALFHRAKNLYDLSQIYAQPYRKESANNDIGIPLKEGIDVTATSKRSSVKQTYEYIINDLQRALKLLPPRPELVTRGSKSSAFALLARVYLIIGDFEKALSYSDSTFNIYNKLIDYNTIPLNSTNLGEFNAEVLFSSSSTGYWLSTFLSGFAAVDAELFSLYNENDLRSKIFFIQAAGRIEFKGSYTNSRIPFTGLATDEVYLIRAECNARLGDISTALRDLNYLLRNRWKTGTFKELTAVDSEEMLRLVLIERRKELLFRTLRWSDLRRLNLDDRFRKTIVRTIGGATYTLEPNSYKYTFPLPEDVKALSGMPQTPGW